VPAFLDVHSHVIPSGDDGASSVEEGLALCREAARRGTRILYGTPHVWPVERLSRERERAVRKAHAEMAPVALEGGLELRLGFELTPSRALLDEDLGRYALEGLAPLSVLIEFPFSGDLEMAMAVAEHAETLGLRPVLAHPERAEAILAEPGRVEPFAERGWPIQVNATSLTGYHGPASEELGWRLAAAGVASLVGSDGHRLTRPPFLDDAYRMAGERLGASADSLFDGTGLASPGERSARPAARNEPGGLSRAGSAAAQPLRIRDRIGFADAPRGRSRPSRLLGP